MKAKYIFLDVDGTLLNYQSRVPSSALEALNEAHRRGHQLIVCTGRQRSQLPKELKKIPFDGVISDSGASVECGGEVVYESAWSEQELCEVLDYLDDDGAVGLLHTKSGQLVDGRFHTLAVPYMLSIGFDAEIIRTAFGEVRLVDDLHAARDVQKVFYYLSTRRIDQIDRDLGERYFVTDYSVGEVRGDRYYGEITQRHVCKSQGLYRYLEHVGASVGDSIAVGDSGNDLDMIRAAGVGVAMGNATDEIKKAADLVTTHIDEDGIKTAFCRLGLI